MNPAQRSGDIIRKAGKATLVLQGFAVILLLGLGILFVGISQKYSALHDGIRENALWSVYQLDREARRLHETIHVMLVEKDLSARRIKSLGMRYDILYSRMNILEKTSFERTFKIDPTIESQIAEIRQVVFGRTAMFDRLAAGGTVNPTELETTDREFEQLVQNTEKLLLYSNNTVSIERADARNAVLSLQIKSAGLVALLVGCVVILIFMLRRQLTSVRLAGLSLEAISNRLTEAFVSAEAGNRAKSQFMATMSHEIRTPLNAILGTAELLELSPLPRSIGPGVRTIRRSGQALLEIINEILDFAKIEYGNLDVENRAVDVHAVVMATVEIIRDRAKENGNRIVLNIPDQFSERVITSDPTRLRQVLLNLLSNAIKFTQDGVVTLHISEPPMDHPVLRFEISDTGIGIDQDGLCKLFQPFSQVDASISRKYGGTGLGLTICKQIVEALDGKIGVESSKGQGSTFWFEIPALPADGTIVNVELFESQTHELLPALDILLVEDNPVNQQVAAGFLSHLGQLVTIANDGLEAVEMAQTKGFDLILMDMQMTKLDGIAATRRIRASGGLNRNVPIIAMTANASDDDRRLCEEAGMTGFQSKPVALQQLRDIVGALDVSSIVRHDDVQEPGTRNTPFETRRGEIVEALGHDAFDELLSSFFDDATTLLTDLHAALSANDYRNTDRILHILKGAASNIGLQDVADYSQALRQASFSEDALTKLQKTVAGHKQRHAA